MEFQAISKNKRAFLPLLLLGDEQEDMIDRYLDRGTLWALYDGELQAVCVVTEEGSGDFEIKNLAVAARLGAGLGGARAPPIPGTGDAPAGGHRGQPLDHPLL